MPKDRYVFEDEGRDRKMTVDFPLLGEVLVFPVGALSVYSDEGLTTPALDNGWKQRVQDFGAQSKDGTARQKEQAWFDRSCAYLDHLQDGGDWKMTAVGLTRDLIAAMLVVNPKFTEAQIKAGAKAKPEQIAEWRSNADVKLELSKIRLAKATAAAAASKEVLKINL